MVVVLMVFTFSMLFGTQVYASENTNTIEDVNRAAENVVIEFFNAIMNNDMETALAISVDEYENEIKRQEAFKETQQELEDYSIEDINMVDADRVLVTVNVTVSGFDSVIEYPVVKIGDKWVLDNTSANVYPRSLVGSYGSLKAWRDAIWGDAMVNDDIATITDTTTAIEGIEGVSVGTYDMEWSASSWLTCTSMVFTLTTGILAVSGYQYPYGGGTAKISYWVAKKSGLLWSSITSQVVKTGNGSINPLYFRNLPTDTTLALQATSATNLDQYCYGYLYDGE